jgi:hypothetical protein
MLHTDYQLAVSHGYLVRFCLKIKRYRDVAHHWTALLSITRSWAKLSNTHTHTHTHIHTLTHTHTK